MKCIVFQADSLHERLASTRKHFPPRIVLSVIKKRPLALTFLHTPGSDDIGNCARETAHAKPGVKYTTALYSPLSPGIPGKPGGPIGPGVPGRPADPCKTNRSVIGRPEWVSIDQGIYSGVAI